MPKLNDLDYLVYETVLNKPTQNGGCHLCLYSEYYDGWFYCGHLVNQWLIDKGHGIGLETLIFNYLNANYDGFKCKNRDCIISYEVGSYCKLFEQD